jgi:hypothetical protein
VVVAAARPFPAIRMVGRAPALGLAAAPTPKTVGDLISSSTDNTEIGVLIAATSYAGAFDNLFRKRCDVVGLFHCRAHRLSKAAATRSPEAGARSFGLRGLVRLDLNPRSAHSARRGSLPECAVSNPGSGLP